MKKVTLCAFLLFLFSGIQVSAQNQDVREEYEKFRQQIIRSYSNFREECNKQYADFLKKAWEWYNVAPVLPRPFEKEKPPVVIDDDKKDEPVKDNEVPYEDVITVPEVEPQPEPIEPIVPVPVIKETWFDFAFCGTIFKVRADETLKFRLKSLDGDALASAWDKLARSNHNNLLSDCLSIREKQHLCDWAYLTMLVSFSNQFAGEGNESALLTAFLFSQSGYKMRLGISDDKLFVLFGTKHQIFEMPYFDLDGEYFYPLGKVGNNIQIANFAFQQEKNLSLLMPTEPVLARKASKSRVLTSKKYNTVTSCSVNENLLAFFEKYPSSQLNDNPMTRWAMYANTPLDAAVKASLYPSLKKAIAGKSAAESADILLNFVQTAFEYEYDDKVWGGDRAFFAEESLYYPYCDCEDRSILFSRLVRDLLGLDVVLVYYPGHLATAVKFNETVKGDYLSLKEGRFLICDPTYIGAPIGMTMPDMDNNKATVILLK